jgi:hypothetical protein
MLPFAYQKPEAHLGLYKSAAKISKILFNTASVNI